MTPDLWAFRPVVPTEGIDLRGMAVQAADGGIGKVEDVVERGARTFLLVDTGPWIFGKTIKLPAGLVLGVDAAQRIVLVDGSKEHIKNAPEQDADLVDDAEHEEALARHYAGDGDVGPAVAAPSGPSEAVPGATSAPVEDRGADREDVEALPPVPSLEPDRSVTPGATGDVAGRTPSPAPAERGDDTGTRPGPTDRPDVVPAPERQEEPADAGEAAAPPPARRAPEPSGVDAPTPLSGLATREAPPAEERPPAPSPQEAEETAREEQRRPAAARRRDQGAERPGDAPTRARAEAPSRLRSTVTDGKPAETPSRRRSTGTATKRTKAPAAAESAPRTAKPQAQRAKGARNDAPLPRYDSLTAAEVVGRLRALTQSELAKVERYEKRADGRQTILKRVASLREKEPWRGYDTATVKEVRERLARATADRVAAVRDYERRHRNRTGVMDAARRRLESM